jgi:hypothetical protein
MAVPMRSTDFRAIVEPILNESFDGVYDQRADEWSQVFSERTGIARNVHEEPVLYGMGSAPELPDGQPVTYDSGGQLYTARYLYKVYGLAFALTKVLVEDGDHIRLGTLFSRHLAQSMVETKETLGANILNRSFNAGFPGGDASASAAPAAAAAGGGAGGGGGGGGVDGTLGTARVRGEEMISSALASSSFSSRLSMRPGTLSVAMAGT